MREKYLPAALLLLLLLSAAPARSQLSSSNANDALDFPLTVTRPAPGEVAEGEAVSISCQLNGQAMVGSQCAWTDPAGEELTADFISGEVCSSRKIFTTSINTSSSSSIVIIIISNNISIVIKITMNNMQQHYLQQQETGIRMKVRKASTLFIKPTR